MSLPSMVAPTPDTNAATNADGNTHGGPGNELEHLTKLMAKLPGMGPRSARRAVLHLLKKRETLLQPLITSLQATEQAMVTCGVCGNLDTQDPCHICQDPRRDEQQLCVVADVADLWALERSHALRGRYHVLGGVMSAMSGIGPDSLNIPKLVERCDGPNIKEVILALNATVEGQTTAHYVAEHLKPCGVKITQLAHGVPMGGELDYLDEGTLMTALNARLEI